MSRTTLLGKQVKDQVTGFTGIVTVESDWMHQSPRCHVQPQELKDGSTVKGEWFDALQLEVTGDGIVPLANTVPKYGHGSKVKDNQSGLVGEIMCVSRFLYGCVRYTIQGPRKLLGMMAGDDVDTAEGFISVIVPKNVPRPATAGPANDRLPRDIKL